MKKKLLAVLLAVALVLLLVPAALAEELDNTADGAVSSAESSADASSSETTDDVTPGEDETNVEDKTPGEDGTNVEDKTPGEDETNVEDKTPGEDGTNVEDKTPGEDGTNVEDKTPGEDETNVDPADPADPADPVDPVDPEDSLTEEELESYYQQWLSDPDSGVTDSLTDAQWQQLNEYINQKKGEVVIPPEPVIPAAPQDPECICAEDCTGVGCPCPCHQQSLYDRVMACETLDEIWEILDEATDEELEALTEEEYNQIDAFIVDLIEQDIAEKKAHEEKITEVHPDTTEDSEIIYPTVNMDDVAPLGAPVVGGAE